MIFCITTDQIKSNIFISHMGTAAMDGRRYKVPLLPFHSFSIHSFMRSHSERVKFVSLIPPGMYKRLNCRQWCLERCVIYVQR